MGIQKLYDQREILEFHVAELTKVLNTYSRNEIGLVPDSVKETDHYEFTKRSFDVAFRQLQDFNSKLTRKQKLELRDMKRGISLADGR